ncbi:MAG: hypothetical protein MSIBF_06470 [Candidatus Altiarchaeales archaeon IMC4]|nr:MAG: hypothetical protein MSIBF_06470 [Candidatus Altiarchaeales archaeon IMC4]
MALVYKGVYIRKAIYFNIIRGSKMIGGKKLSEYKEIIKTPLIVLVGWTLVSIAIGFGLQFMMPGAGQTETSGAMTEEVVNELAPSMVAIGISLVVTVLGILVAIGVYGYTGWTAVKKHNGNLATGAIAGALLGLIASVISGVIGIIVMLVSIGTGVSGTEFDSEGGLAVSGLIMVPFVIILSLIIAPVVFAIIASVCGVIGALIAGSRKFE